MATASERANEFLSAICDGINDQLSVAAPTMTFALVTWVKGKGDDAKAVALFAHPDGHDEATTALRTVADAFDAEGR